jgi:hypothetical protein
MCAAWGRIINLEAGRNAYTLCFMLYELFITQSLKISFIFCFQQAYSVLYIP